MRIEVVHKSILLAISGLLLYVMTFFIKPFNNVLLAIKIAGNTFFLVSFGFGLAGIVMSRSKSLSERFLKRNLCKKCERTFSSSARYCGSCGGLLSHERG